MKNLVTLAVFTAVIATSLIQVSAMSMEGSGAMMDHAMMSGSTHTMMKDKMTMKSDGMMKGTMSMKHMSVAALAKHFGYTWSKDRKTLATMAGVTGYTGTRAQNLVIRAYLTSDKMMMKSDTTMTHDTMQK